MSVMRLQWLVWLMVLLNFATAGPVLNGASANDSHHRMRRNLIQLCEVIGAYSPLNCWSFNNYGCFCGYGGEGNTPVDEVDRCCMIHDACYRNLNCWGFADPHIVSYSVSLGERSGKCNDSPTEWPCSYQTCTCDVQFAECLSKTKYNSSYKFYDRKKCK